MRKSKAFQEKEKEINLGGCELKTVLGDSYYQVGAVNSEDESDIFSFVLFFSQK